MRCFLLEVEKNYNRNNTRRIYSPYYFYDVRKTNTKPFLSRQFESESRRMHSLQSGFVRWLLERSLFKSGCQKNILCTYSTYFRGHLYPSWYLVSQITRRHLFLSLAFSSSSPIYRISLQTRSFHLGNPLGFISSGNLS